MLRPNMYGLHMHYTGGYYAKSSQLRKQAVSGALHAATVYKCNCIASCCVERVEFGLRGCFCLHKSRTCYRPTASCPSHDVFVISRTRTGVSVMNSPQTMQQSSKTCWRRQCVTLLSLQSSSIIVRCATVACGPTACCNLPRLKINFYTDLS